MGAVNVTIRVEEETKRQFDTFCENVGMNITTAFSLYMKAVLRTRRLPFNITDIEESVEARSVILARGKKAFKYAREQAIVNGTSNMTIDEINDEIDAYRRERREL